MGKQLKCQKGRLPGHFQNLRFRKSQVSMEFVFLIGLAFVVMLVFINATRSEFDTLRDEEERSLLKDLGVSVQRELMIASNLQDGYFRTFEVPQDLEEISYTIQIVNTTLLAYTSNHEYVLNIPIVIGNVQKGNNTINKTGGQLYLN